METEQRDRSDNPLANGNNNPTKRGRGRPRGSVKKKIMSVTEVTHNARASTRVNLFSPDAVLKPKVKKRGRPKKIKIPGRPRKIPLTPEEEAERILRFSKQRKRKISKPLGRPRIHPLVDVPKIKRGRGRPRKYEPVTITSSENSTVNGNLKKSFKRIPEFGESTPRKRGRPRGSFKKIRGRPAGSCPTKSAVEWTPGKRGRPPGSGTKIKAKEEANAIPGTKVKVIMQETDGMPRKMPPGSGTKVKVAPQNSNETPRKRGRPPGSGKSKTDVKDTDSDFNSSALSASDQPRKRGRPSKASMTKGSSLSNDSLSHMRARILFASSENSNEEAEIMADDVNASKNDAVVETPPLPTGDGIVAREAGKQATIEKNGRGEYKFVMGHGSSSRKSASSRVTSKSQKKK